MPSEGSAMVFEIDDGYAHVVLNAHELLGRPYLPVNDWLAKEVRSELFTTSRSKYTRAGICSQRSTYIHFDWRQLGLKSGMTEIWNNWFDCCSMFNVLAVLPKLKIVISFAEEVDMKGFWCGPWDDVTFWYPTDTSGNPGLFGSNLILELNFK